GAGADAVAGRRVRFQAGAGDPRRRRSLRPRLDSGRDRRGFAVLHALARHSVRGGARVADRKFHRRGHRQGRGRPSAHGAGRHGHAPAGHAFGLAGLEQDRFGLNTTRRRRTHMTAMMKETDITGEAAYDVETIRTDFPILYREVYGKPLVYLDNGASAQKPRSVLDAIDYAYKMEYANVHRGLHFLSNAATARYEDARETVRR